MLPTTAVKMGYLLDLSRSEFGHKYQAHVLTRLLDIVKPITSLSAILPVSSSREALAQAVDDLRNRLGDDELGQEISTLITMKLDGFLDRTDSAESESSDDTATAPQKPPRAKSAKDENSRTFKAGDIIFRESEPGDEAFVIFSGEVQISVGEGENRVVIATLDRGEVFGEMALVDDEPRMATATAMRDTAVYIVPQEMFKKRLSWLAEEDRLISHIVETLVSRLRGKVTGQ
jgi:hypothetical protein